MKYSVKAWMPSVLDLMSVLGGNTYLFSDLVSSVYVDINTLLSLIWALTQVLKKGKNAFAICFKKQP